MVSTRLPSGTGMTLEGNPATTLPDAVADFGSGAATSGLVLPRVGVVGVAVGGSTSEPAPAAGLRLGVGADALGSEVPVAT